MGVIAPFPDKFVERLKLVGDADRTAGNLAKVLLSATDVAARIYPLLNEGPDEIGPEQHELCSQLIDLFQKATAMLETLSESMEAFEADPLPILDQVQDQEECVLSVEHPGKYGTRFKCKRQGALLLASAFVIRPKPTSIITSLSTPPTGK